MKRMSCVLVLLCSVLAFSGQGISDDDVNADYYFTRGEHYNQEQNYPEAAKWYQKAAELGHAGAQNALGALYFKVSACRRITPKP